MTVSDGPFELYKVTHCTVAASCLHMSQPHSKSSELPSHHPLFSPTHKIAASPICARPPIILMHVVCTGRAGPCPPRTLPAG